MNNFQKNSQNETRSAKPPEENVTQSLDPLAAGSAEGDFHLSYLEETDIPLLLNLFNEPDAAGFYVPTLRRPYSAAQLQGMLATWNDRSESYLFAIRKEGVLVGIVNAEGVNWVNRNTEIGIALAGPEQRGKGYASQVLRLLLTYLFQDAGMHRVYCRIMEGNDASVRLFKKAGFSYEGTLRQHVFRRGHFVDLHLYALLAEEWFTEKDG